MNDAIMIIIMKNCNDFQGSSRLQTSHRRSCFQCKGNSV